jgi:hypothetical protein
LACSLAAALPLLGVGVAFGVSGGGYDPAQQDCSPQADANNAVGAEEGCHNYKLNVGSGEHRYAEFGIDQIANNSNQNAHSGMFRVNTNSDGSGLGVAGTFDTNYQPIPPDGPSEFGLLFYPLGVAMCLAGGGAPDTCVFSPVLPDQPPTIDAGPETGTPDGSITEMATQSNIYLGADDNLNGGEHDGVDGQYGTDQMYNGPSDGGAVVVNWHPLATADWVDVVLGAIGAGDFGVVLSNPIPAFDAVFGMCTDGVCASAQTTKRVVYQGGGEGERDVYNYEGKDWDPQGCSSGGPQSEQECSASPGSAGNTQDMNAYRAEEKTVVAQPGFQFYEDPDPSGSPLGPYPLPALYAGTCGVAAGGGPSGQAPASPFTNSAGQVIISTGC